LSEDNFDAIVVGGGPAGTIAAYLMAKAGLEVVLVERGTSCGSKNLTGGRVYSHSLAKVFPDFSDEAPLERPVTREAISMMTADNMMTVDFDNPKWQEKPYHSFTVCRNSFDSWLADQAEAAGVMLVNGIRVDSLLMEGEKVTGIVAGEDEMPASVTILADGVNSLLGQQAGLVTGDIKASQVAVGVKEVISLSEKEIEARFHLRPGEGLAQLLVGDCSQGVLGGGFLYTNRDTVSLGILFTVEELVKAGVSVPDAMERFRQHPCIAPLLAGGKVVEYGGHLVPEGGWQMKPYLYGDGVLIAGDAAGFVLNCGYMVRGIDLAITSGILAAETVIEAKAAGDFGESKLKLYEDKVLASHIYQDLQTFERIPHFLEDTPRMFKEYPQMVTLLMERLFTARGEKPRHIRDLATQAIGETTGWLNLVHDGLKGVRAF
jgi:electron transfer flavoprotein-quinone oxidoreductase